MSLIDKAVLSVWCCMVYGDYVYMVTTVTFDRLSPSVTICLRMINFWVRIIQAKQSKLQISLA